MRRRHLLRTTALALTAGLAGCSGGDDGTDTEPSGADTPTATPTDTDTATPTDTEATPTETPPPTPTTTPTDPGTTPTETPTADPSTPTPSPTPGGGTPTATPDAGSPTATPADTPTPTATPTPTDTPTPSPTPTPTSTPVPTTSARIVNVGFSAWEVTEGASEIAPDGGENPTMVFEVGRRYAVENGGWDVHPFALRASDDAELVSQQPTVTGSYEDDDAVNWADDGDSFAFTMTSALAAEVDYYTCTAHGSMRGDVTTE